jgi:hypothetical protein
MNFLVYNIKQIFRKIPKLTDDIIVYRCVDKIYYNKSYLSTSLIYEVADEEYCNNRKNTN